MNAITSFEFDNARFRAIDRADGRWIVLADACQLLGHSNASAAAAAIPASERAKASVQDTIGRTVEFNIVSMAGLARLVMRSRKPNAESFRKWAAIHVFGVGEADVRPAAKGGRALVPFDFETAAVRIENRDGSPWFVASDVCDVLEITKHRDAVARLDDDETTTVIVDTLGGPQSVCAISESGLYALIIRSRKPAAKRFRKWVTSVVLPTLRQSGSYSLSPAPILPRDPRELLVYLQQQAGDMIELQDANAILTPKAKALDRIAGARGNMNVTEASKVLKVGQRELFRFLNSIGWTYRMKSSGRWQAHSDRERSGLLEMRTARRPSSHGPDHVDTDVMVTPKGLAKLAELLSGGGGR